jgi:hypothetical protein
MKIQNFMRWTRNRTPMSRDDIFDLIHREMNRAMDDTYHGHGSDHEAFGNGQAGRKADRISERGVEAVRADTGYPKQTQDRIQQNAPKLQRRPEEKPEVRVKKTAVR